jgi:hypothetical protein
VRGREETDRSSCLWLLILPPSHGLHWARSASTVPNYSLSSTPGQRFSRKEELFRVLLDTTCRLEELSPTVAQNAHVDAPQQMKHKLVRSKCIRGSNFREKNLPKERFLAEVAKLATFHIFTHRAAPHSSQYNDAGPLWSATMIVRNVLPPFKNANILKNP